MSLFVGIVYNPSKEESKKIIRDLESILQKEGIDFFVLKADFSGFSTNIDSYKDIKKPDFVIAIGGDGTILYASRLFARYGVPIAGVDVGKLGFLMHFSQDEIHDLIRLVLESKYDTEDRMMINAKVRFKSGKIYENSALNEVVVSRGKFHRLIDIDVIINNEFFNRYRADGIVVATPTGSTAYSLSAFGPILMPTMENIVITPICPHTLSARSVVIDSNAVVVIKIDQVSPSPVVVFDGQDYIDINESAEIEVSKSKFFARIVKNPKKKFFEIIRSKLNW